MKNLFTFLLLFLIFYSLSKAQISDNIKLKVDSFPTKINSVGYLAGIINNSFDNDSDKAGAIYYWMAKYFDYDVKKHFSKHEKYSYDFRYKSHDDKVEKIHKADWGMYYYSLKKRKATYRGYAYLYKQLCNNVGLECVIVEGSGKNGLKSIGKKAGRKDYMWNAVKINGVWQLVDVVYGSGILDEKNKTFTKSFDDSFLFTSPQIFFLNHYPKKREWLLCEKCKDDFAFLPLYYRFFIDSGLHLQDPAPGIISSIKEDSIVSIVFKISSDLSFIQNNKFSYSLESNGKIKDLDVEDKGDKLILKIPVSERKSDYLNIYLNSNLLVSYRIKLS